MTYKVNDLVYFNYNHQTGVGKIVAVVEETETTYLTYLVHSTQIVNGHESYGDNAQDNTNNWWFKEAELKPFFKKVGQKYKVIGNVDEDAEISIGDIIALISIENDNLSYYESENVPSFLMYDLDHPKCEVEFYEDVEEAPSAKEDEMFTKDDLKAGYLVKVRKGKFAHVVDSTEEGLCLNYEGGWDKLSSYSDSLHSPYSYTVDIMEVYGFTERGMLAHKFELVNRKLLWKREEVKEMTIEEIQKVLGYKIKVVE